MKKILNKYNLIDIGFIGLPYTWWDNRTQSDAVFERLDRVVAKAQWLNIYGDASLETFPIIGSDHGPILLSLDHWNKTGKYRPFRFEMKWFLNDSFRQLVQYTWKKCVKGSCAFQLARKVEILKKKRKKIKIWEKACYNKEVNDIDKRNLLVILLQ